MSHTAILINAHSTDAKHGFAVQFRSDKEDLYGVSEASRIHGAIVPVVTYQGMNEVRQKVDNYSLRNTALRSGISA